MKINEIGAIYGSLQMCIAIILLFISPHNDDKVFLMLPPSRRDCNDRIKLCNAARRIHLINFCLILEIQVDTKWRKIAERRKCKSELKGEGRKS